MAVITTLLTIRNKIWQKGEWPTPWTQSLVITLLTKGNRQQCQNYRAIRIISHPSTVSLGGKTITNLRSADDIDGLAGEEEELEKLDGRLDKASTAYGMEISAEKTTWMKNSTSGINKEIKVNGQRAGSDKLQ